MQEFWKTLSDSGITLAQLLAFGLAIVASYLSARWGGAESRRQFAIKQVSDKRTAALELIPVLMKLAALCENKRGNLDLYMQSDGQDGTDEGMRGIDIDPSIHASAARLSTEVAEGAIKLEVIRDRAVTYFREAAGHIDEDEYNDALLSIFALLALKARYLVDLAAKDASLRLKHPEEDMAILLKAAIKHGYRVDSGDELSWY